MQSNSLPGHIQPTVKYRNAGGLREVPTDLIEREAIDAARTHRSLVDACPYPFATQAGAHFTATWFLHTNATDASVNTRPEAI